MNLHPGPYLKAIVAGSLAGLGTLYAALGDGHVTNQEWVQVAIYTITAAAAIYGVPNTTPAPAPAPAVRDNTPTVPAPDVPAPTPPVTTWPAAAIAAAAETRAGA